jgi:hypothetical protein
VTKAQAKLMRLMAAKARRMQETPTQEEIAFVDDCTHPAQRSGLGYAAQRGPGYWAEEVERIVAAYQLGFTPAEVENERQPSR